MASKTTLRMVKLLQAQCVRTIIVTVAISKTIKDSIKEASACVVVFPNHVDATIKALATRMAKEAISRNVGRTNDRVRRVMRRCKVIQMRQLTSNSRR